jgi:hypothetical protein
MPLFMLLMVGRFSCALNTQMSLLSVDKSLDANSEERPQFTKGTYFVRVPENSKK